MSVDFKKHSAISELQKHGPHKLYCVQGYHAEPDAHWNEACFFYKSEAEKALDWICINRPEHDGSGGEIFHEIIETKLTKWKGE